MKVFMKNFYLFLFGKILFAPLVPKRACFGLVVLPNLGPIALGAAPNLPPGVVDGDFVFIVLSENADDAAVFFECWRVAVGQNGQVI